MHDSLLFVDLLYKKNGSFDEDARQILKFSGKVKKEYLKCEYSFFANFIAVLNKVLSRKFNKVIFLSSNLKYLFLFSPLCFFLKCYSIIHFLPSKNTNVHIVSLFFLQHFYSFGVYSRVVAKKLNPFLINEVFILPSRYIDIEQTKSLIANKLKKKSYFIFVPGVRPGIRNEINLIRLKKTLSQKIAMKINAVYLQTSNLKSDSLDGIKYLPVDMEIDEYLSYFKKSLIVVIDFFKTYEPRASGVILDALTYGCIVLTKNHPINLEYGYPKSLVCNEKNLLKLFNKIKNENDFSSLVSVSNFKNFKKDWSLFLK
jgi:hypothetical protein